MLLKFIHFRFRPCEVGWQIGDAYRCVCAGSGLADGLYNHAIYVIGHKRLPVCISTVDRMIFVELNANGFDSMHGLWKQALNSNYYLDCRK